MLFWPAGVALGLVWLVFRDPAFDYRMVVESSKLVLDTRNAIGANGGSHVFRLGAPQAPGAKAQGSGLAAARRLAPETAPIPAS